MGSRFEEIALLFARARRLGPTERASFLRDVCGDDAAMRDEVAELLRAHDLAGTGTGDPFAGAAAPALAARVVGQVEGAGASPPRVAGFRILRRLAEGGMGTVYLAEQEKPRRSVALKVLRPEAASAEGRRRFEREAEVLARLEHPGIARVLVFGTTQPPGEPRPFLAMELVEGEPLTAATPRMGLPERLVLLAEVAEAVAHAHARGVIHRDLKPDNILVQASGRPKVVDFGVARLVEDEEAQRTGAGLVIGTLAYMSPEQARGDSAAVDTRSDVYSLGVVAYEVLTGRHPLGGVGGSFPELVRRIAAETPPDPAGIDRRLRGDVSLIVRKALEKEPERRYAGASAFADDLRRHLRDEPILARPMTGAHQVRRLVRRHKRAVAVGALALLALVGGLVGALGLARSAQRERLRADRGAEVLRRSLARRSVDVAAVALRQHEAAAAIEALARVPPNLRGWEWDHLAAAADDSHEAEPAGFEDMRDGRLGADGREWIARDGAGALHHRGKDDPVPTRVPWPEGAPRPSLTLLGATPVVVGRRGEGLVIADAAGRALATSTVTERGPLEASAGSGDGRFLAVAFNGRRMWCPLHLLDARSGESLLRGTSGPVETGALAFSSDARLLACGGWDGTVRVLTLESRESKALVGHTGVALALAFSGDGRRLASGSRDRTAHVWDVASGSHLLRLSAHAGEVGVVAFSPDGRLLATGSSDATVRVWDVATGAPLRVLVGHRGTVRDVRFTGGDALTSLAADGLRRWRVGPDPGVLRVHRGVAEGNRHPYVYAVAFSPDGRFLASGGWDGTVRVVDVATSELLTTIESGDPAVHGVRWTSDGRWLVGGHARLVRWDPFTGGEVASWKGSSLEGFAVARDGRVLSGGADGVVRVHRASDLAPVAAWSGHGGAVVDLSVSPLGDRVASLDARGAVIVRSIESGRELWRRPAHSRATFGAVAFSPDGRRLATGGGDRLVRLWDAATGADTAVLGGHNDAVYGLAWLPDGTRLFSGSNDSTVRVWDPDSRQACLELRGHSSYVYRLDVSPDGTTLASASGDDTVRLWSTVPTPRRERERRERLAARAAAEQDVADAIAAGTSPRALLEATLANGAADPGARAVRLVAIVRRLEPTPARPRSVDDPPRVDSNAEGD